MSETSDARDVLLNQLADEFAARQRAGERPRLDEYCDRHPDLADDIRSLFPALVELERAKADAGPELAVAGSRRPAGDPPGRLPPAAGSRAGAAWASCTRPSSSRWAGTWPSRCCRPRPSATRGKRRRLRARGEGRRRSCTTPTSSRSSASASTTALPYYVMQFIHGLGLDAVLDELGRLPAGGRTADADAGRRPATGRPLSVALARVRSLGTDDAGTAGWKAAGRRRRYSIDVGRRDDARPGHALPARPRLVGVAQHLGHPPARPVRVRRGARSGEEDRPTGRAWPGSACRWPTPWPTPTSRASCTATSSRPTCCSTCDGHRLGDRLRPGQGRRPTATT